MIKYAAVATKDGQKSILIMQRVCVYESPTRKVKTFPVKQAAKLIHQKIGGRIVGWYDRTLALANSADIEIGFDVPETKKNLFIWNPLTAAVGEMQFLDKVTAKLPKKKK